MALLMEWEELLAHARILEQRMKDWEIAQQLYRDGIITRGERERARNHVRASLGLPPWNEADDAERKVPGEES